MAFQGESFIQRYGKQAALAAPPVKKMLEIGVPVGLGTDGTRVSTYNPWVALYWITTGKTIGGVQQLAKQNVVDRLTALQLFTTGSYSLIKENDKGRIQPGYAADLVMLNDDYFSVDEEQIKNIRSVLTIVDGKVVYGDGEYTKIAPPPLKVLPEWSPVKHFGGYQH